jgi:sec-independent protein translocase protein TatC
MSTTLRPPARRIPPTPAESEVRLSLADHLEELRRRLGLCLGAVLLATGVSVTQADRILEWLRAPAAWWLPRFAFFSPAEALLAYVKVAALGGLSLAMPVLLWQAWGFVRPGLRPAERRYGLLFIWAGTASFVAGVLFAYRALLPPALRFLLSIGAPQLQPVISVDRYVAFVATLLFWCGAVFELPVVLWLLANVGIVTAPWLRQQRPYAVLVMAIAAALITPTTDPVNLLLVAAPMAGLYEASIWLVHFTRARRRDPRGGG